MDLTFLFSLSGDFAHKAWVNCATKIQCHCHVTMNYTAVLR